MFCKLRPKHVMKCNLLSRNTCLCSAHQKMALKFVSMKAAGASITSTNPDALVRTTSSKEFDTSLETRGGSRILQRGGGAEQRAPKERGEPRRGESGGRWRRGAASPPPRQLGGLGERCKLPQRGPGRSPGRSRVFLHSKGIWRPFQAPFTS